MTRGGTLRRVLLGLCGGIAAYKGAYLIRRLRERGLAVRCAPTLAAESFVSPLTLEVLSGERVYGQNYLAREGGQGGAELHVEAAQWADLLCIAPATANTLARLALGLADDFLSTAALMFEGPLVVAPAMHDAMWRKPQVAEHVAALRARGATIVGPVEGALASGERGWGRMAEPDEIAEVACRALALPEAGGEAPGRGGGGVAEAPLSNKDLAKRFGVSTRTIQRDRKHLGELAGGPARPVSLEREPPAPARTPEEPPAPTPSPSPKAAAQPEPPEAKVSAEAPDLAKEERRKALIDRLVSRKIEQMRPAYEAGEIDSRDIAKKLGRSVSDTRRRMKQMGMLATAGSLGVAEAPEGAEAAAPLAGRRVVVTAGPTHEAVDPVRFLGNRSSGRMGFALARQAALRGAEVTLIAGPVHCETPAGVRRIDVVSAADMESALAEAGPEADLVVMAAAVGDYRPRQCAARKLKKSGVEGMVLELEQTPDLLAGLAALAPRALLVGFAAETDSLEEAARGKLEAKRAHFIVANDVSRADIGFEAADNEVVVFGRNGDPVRFSKQPKEELAGRLLELFAADRGAASGN